MGHWSPQTAGSRYNIDSLQEVLVQLRGVCDACRVACSRGWVSGGLEDRRTRVNSESERRQRRRTHKWDVDGVFACEGR
ncbi:hypothetical protein AAMO2058_001017700, partial [Amorphochlora amoebiformis]